ncbi:MAG: hypothetical protein Q8N81_00980 [bacterium]|nr:hypothetical protein [bacterium]
MKQKVLLENAIKHAFIVLVLLAIYPAVHGFLSTLRPQDYDIVTIASSLLIMAYLFADYAFTYSVTNLKMVGERFLDHLITSFIIFGTGGLLMISVVSLEMAVQKDFAFFRMLALIFYASLALYDFWDLNRALKNYK